MDKEEYLKKKRWAGELRPSMKRRRIGHDYRSRCIYMVTLVVEQRRPLLGRVTGNGTTSPATFTPSLLGEAIIKELHDIPRYYPDVAIWDTQLMPDHLHFIIFVKKPINVHLGTIINGFKVGCNRAYKQLMEACEITSDIASLWEQGYNDRILDQEGQLQGMKRYLHDNPRRLAIKRSHPDLFRVQSDAQAAGYHFAALGNIFLLDAPLRVAVKCSRRLSDEEINEQCRRFLLLASEGAVLVSPSISPGEKAVMRAAFTHGYPIIILLENGFNPLAKPGGKRFDACANGKLLLLAPWPHHNDRRVIHRQQCINLNDMARDIATEQPRSRNPGCCKPG